MKYWILLLCVSLLLTACSGGHNDLDDGAIPPPAHDSGVGGADSVADGDDSGVGGAVSDAATGSPSLKDIFSQGKAIKCTYKIGSSGSNLNVESWVQGRKSRVVMSGAMDSEMIVTDDGAFSKIMPDRPLADCDWLKISVDDVDNTISFDPDDTLQDVVIKNKDTYVSMNCDVVKVSNDLFSVDGKVCDMNNMMNIQ